MDRPYESKDEAVNPQHYQSKTGLEVIEVIEAFTEDLTGIEAVCTGNALKYICRWYHKNGVEDIEKAIWYLKYLQNYLDKEDDVHMNPNNDQLFVPLPRYEIEGGYDE